MEKEHFKLYVVAEMTYANKYKNYYDEIFPDNWFMIKDYKTKIKILSECIKNNTLIKDSELYLNMYDKESHKKMWDFFIKK